MRVAFLAPGATEGPVVCVRKCGPDWADDFPGEVGIESETAKVGDEWNGSEFVVPAPAPPSTDDLVVYASTKRWSVEVGGITVAGIQISTDDRSKIMISGARIAAQADAGFTTKWVAADGTVHDLDAEQVIAISDAVLAHVSAAFATYSAVLSGIYADPPTITTLAEVDAAAWPANA